MLLEAFLVLVVVGVSMVAPAGFVRFLNRLLRPVFRISRRRRTACAVVGILTLAISVGLTSQHFPLPAAHDEFCYLLGADTFVHGRFTNPTHAMWRHFETFHTIHQPTYQMKYPVAQSLFLALGQAVWHPMLGVWISLALGVSSVCWALQGWMPSRWAFVGSLCCLLNTRLLLWWGQSYWGGAVAMLGGALLIGALPRLQRRLRVRDACLMGLGLALLANTRPYEGLVASLPVAAAMALLVFGHQRPVLRDTVGKLVLPIVVCLLITASLMGLYNFKVTGSAVRMPYQEWQSQYVAAGFSEFLLGGETNQEERTAKFWLPTQGDSGDTPYEFPAVTANFRTRLLRQWTFYLGPLLTLPFFLGLYHANKKLLVPVTSLLLVWVAIGSQETVGNPHYAAPVACIYWLLVVHGMRCLYAQRSCFGPRGATIATLLLLCLSVVAPFRLASHLSEPVAPFYAWSEVRSQLIREFESRPGNDLIVVRYKPGHHMYKEWVYNQADIDSASVVWARELDTESNAALLEYFADRQVWLLEADAHPPSVHPHRRTAGKQADSQP